MIKIYTDGACLGNPGPGGYAAIIQTSHQEQELVGGFNHTTNNRMEMLAVIKGLEEVLPSSESVLVYSDSQYVINGIVKGWAKQWRANRWVKKDKKPALNPDLWGRLLDLCESGKVDFQWVRGHTGHPENERCDRLAVAASRRPGLPSEPRGDQ